ncbi:MAG: hypothetical protein K8F62_17805 [Pseudorhodoplanes sp.]|nr:hypothetical protein [Pseudorhodoplanes sp.]
MMTELFEKVGIALLVAVPTALLTVWLSLRRFYREKWWEAKMRAYAEVIQSLHDMKRDLDVSIRAELKGRNTNTRFFKKSWIGNTERLGTKFTRTSISGHFCILQGLLRSSKN